MKIDYLGHSGFLVETDRLLLLFDYYIGGLSLIGQKPADKELFVFSSHAHPDHFNQEIFSLAKESRRVKYILSSDIKKTCVLPDGAEALWLDAGQCREIAGLGTITTLLSTDEGVAFLVDTGREKLFHAGDLNWWDWEGEDPEWLCWQENTFKSQIGKIAGERIDAAFVVLDDRLGDNFDKGLSFFLSVSSPSAVLPMHFTKENTVRRFRSLHSEMSLHTNLLDTGREKHWEI